MSRNQTGRSEIYVHLSLIDGVGPATVQRLLKALETAQVPLAAIYAMKPAEFIEFGRFTSERAQQIHAGLANTRLLDEELKLLEEYKIRLITLEDPSYPHLLKNINLPPSCSLCKRRRQSFFR